LLNWESCFFTTMSITLNPEQETIVANLIATGGFQTTDEVLQVALRLLEKERQSYQTWLTETRGKEAFPETTQQFEEWERRRKRSLHFGLICVFLSAIMQLYPIFFPSSTPPKIKPSNHVQPAINRAT
jgi:Arc/MetJ-type ribon-helix-helix transcriptional regulator